MIILGIDPGTLKMGYGLIQISGGQTTMLSYDVIVNRNIRTLPERLKHIFEILSSVMDTHKPDVVALETAFYGKNVQSVLKLGHARGVIMLAAINRDIPIFEYSPREIKKALVGTGTASKQQVQFMIKSLLKIKKVPKGFDATDALAVAMCHLQRSLVPAKKFTNWKSFLAAHPDRITQ